MKIPEDKKWRYLKIKNMKVPEDQEIKVPEDQEYEGTWRSRIWRYLKIRSSCYNGQVYGENDDKNEKTGE